MQSLIISLALAPLALAARVDLELLATRQSACTDTHIFLAKGNNEPYPGRQGTLVNAICSGLESCDYEDILYYNPVDAPFCDSVAQGVSDGIAQITAYNARCPDSKLVVSGYSQGAQIVGDILGGGGGTFFNGCVQPANAGLDINSAPGNKIAAALVFGDTRHNAGEPYNVLSGANANGLFPRTGSQLAGLLTWTSKFHDYCVATDPICAGGDIVADHLNYFDIYSDTAAAWVKSMLSSASSSPSSSIASSTVASTAASYPTTSVTYSNGTAVSATKISSYLAIPTVTTTYIVTVPCASVDTASLTAYSTFPVTGSVAATGSYAAATSTGKASSTASGAANSTSTFVPVLSNDASSTSKFSMFGLVFAGFVMMVL